jgi:hypothetical protein
MSIDLRISDKPYIADILFKDGTRRRVEHCARTFYESLLIFDTDGLPQGDSLIVNLAEVQTVEVTGVAALMGEAVGRTQ